jgi:hypothetical protein
VNDDPLEWKIQTLRGQLLDLGSAIRQLNQSGLDSAIAQILMSWKRAELEDKEAAPMDFALFSYPPGSTELASTASRTGSSPHREAITSLKAVRGENIAAAPCRREGTCCNLDKNAVVVRGAHALTQERSTSRPKLGIDLCNPPPVPTRVTPRNEQE